STGRQTAAQFGTLRCAPAPVTSNVRLPLPMTDEVAFSLPTNFVKRAYMKSTAVMLIGVLCTAYLVGKHAGIASSLTACAVILALLGCSYWYTLQYKYVFVSPQYFRGKSYFSKRPVTVSWSDPITLAKKNTEEGINGYEIKTATSRYSLFLPEAIAYDPGFQAHISLHAPPNHALLSLCKEA
ncbi:hypothetical protein OPU71_14265, partial [Niveibacterium sp. 24ML]|uniref:hypothetical protein n=1 Tax=Niveibacterium sp. 24ML TaxID=2985512 RepID=UPI00226F50FC